MSWMGSRRSGQCGRLARRRGAGDMGPGRGGGLAPLVVPVLAAFVLVFGAGIARAGPIGICYGRDGGDLPTYTQAVSLLQSTGVSSVRIFDADSGVIQAFADSGIDLSITIANDDLVGIALSQSTSDQWITANVLPYVPATNITSISVGSEVIFSDSANLSAFLVPAMVNVFISLRTFNLQSTVKVTSTNAMNILSVSYPPSAGAFDPSYAQSVIVPMLSFLSQTRSPFFLNSYPYYAYANDPGSIPLGYALFTSNNGVIDSGNNLHYTNLLDAQIDAVFAAISRVNFTDIEIVIAESGWPSVGDASETAATVSNAKTYDQNLINHVLAAQGTPLMPGLTFQTYIFSLYNEDLKTGPTSERNFGIYNPDGTPVYGLNFNGGEGGANRTWCVARSDATNASLAISLNFACGSRLVDCGPIQRGGDCFEPNTYFSHASYAFNDYYQHSNMEMRSCNFSDTATLTSRDPSYGNCEYFARGAAQNLWREHLAQQQAQVIVTIALSLVLVLKLRG